MSTGDKYYTAPLATLKSGQSALCALESVLHCGLVNAGLGYLDTHGEDKFNMLLEQADEAAEKQGLFAAKKGELPPHCQPLTRSQIDLTTSRMEVLKFYLRFRYSKGDRGGKTAYSFRHETREKLAEAVGKYQVEHCFKPTVDGNRAKDRELTIRLQGGSK